jgi:DNA polymerase-3 subunit gamma/tau
MSYLVIARKYRPRLFAELVGQEHVVRTLQNAIARGRLGHAYIFSGTRGVGKTTSARILAKAVNCQEGPAAEPCNVCRFCTEIGEGRSLDVVEIDGASNRGIDDVRMLRENVKFAPAAARRKVYIIDEVHMLTEQAFNALLKTLEEPPDHAIFILATTAADKIPITIQSRCQRFDFRMATREEIIGQLELIAQREGYRIQRRILNDIARASEGSLRDSQSLLEEVVSFAGEEPDQAMAEQVLHVVRAEVVERFLTAVARRDNAELMRIVDGIYQRGFDLRRFLHELMEWVRGMLLVAVSPELEDLLTLAGEDRETLARLSRLFTTGRLQVLAETLIQGERDLKDSTIPRHVMELVALRMSLSQEFEFVQGLVTRLEELSRRLGSGAETLSAPSAGGDPPPPVGETIPQELPPEAEARGAETALPALKLTPPPSDPEVTDEWEGYVEAVKKRKIGLGSFIAHGRLLARGDGVLTIGFTRANAFFYDSTRDSGGMALLQEVAAQRFGEPHRVRLELLPEEGVPEQAPPRRDSDLAVRRRKEATDNPLVREIVDTLGGQVVEIKLLSTRNEGGG